MDCPTHKLHEIKCPTNQTISRYLSMMVVALQITMISQYLSMMVVALQ